MMVVFVSVSGYTTEGVLELLSDTAAACGKTPMDGSWRLQARLSFGLVQCQLLALSRGKFCVCRTTDHRDHRYLHLLWAIYSRFDTASRSTISNQ